MLKSQNASSSELLFFWLFEMIVCRCLLSPPKESRHAWGRKGVFVEIAAGFYWRLPSKEGSTANFSDQVILLQSYLREFVAKDYTFPEEMPHMQIKQKSALEISCFTLLAE